MSVLKRPDLAEHYRDVVDSLKRGRLIPFLGAGVNLCGRDLKKPFAVGRELPSGGELARFLAEKAEHPDLKRTDEQGKPVPLDLLEVAQYLSIMKDEGRLYDELHDLFRAKYSTTCVHRFLASLPSVLASGGCKKPHQLIVTTNYDYVMEDAFEATEPAEAYDLVYYDARGRSEYRGKFWHCPPGGAARPVKNPERMKLPLEERSAVLKIHGAVQRGGESSDDDSYVITEDHYFDYPFYSEIPIGIREEFQKRRFLFLGYSLSDWNLRMIFRRIWREQKLEMESWTVNFRDDPIERLFWEKRKVKYVVANLEDYVHDLTLSLLLGAPPEPPVGGIDLEVLLASITRRKEEG